MKALKFALIGGIAAAAVAGFASAASAETTVAYNVGVANDYVFRGIDQTGGFSKGEVFGGIDLTSGGFYAGTWLSNTGPENNEGAELDIYGGYKLPLGGATLDLGVISYNYSRGSFVSDKLNNYEVKAALSVPVGALTLGGVVYWTPQYGPSGKDGVYYEANAAYTLANKATISGAYGRQTVEKSFYGIDGYDTWNLGVTYPLTDKVSLDGRYIGVSDDATDAFLTPDNGTAVATIKVSF